MANTFDTSRVGGGTYELEQDSTGNYKLKSVGFNQINKLNLPDLKTSDTTSVADTTKKATEDTIKQQTTEVFKPTNVYQGGEGGGQDYANVPTVKEAKVKEATVREAGDDRSPQEIQSLKNAQNIYNKATEALSRPGQFGYSKGYSDPSMQGKTLGEIQSLANEQIMSAKEKYATETQYNTPPKATGLQKVKSKATDTIGNVIDSVKNNKAIQVASNVLGFVANPIIGGAKIIASMLPEDSPENKFNRGYFNLNPAESGGRIAGNPADNVFAGKNAVSMFGDLSKSAEDRISNRNKTAAKNKNNWSKEKTDKFNNKTKEFQNQKNEYDKAKEKTTSSRREQAIMNQKGAGGNDSGGAGGRVICTDLHRTGELSTKDWIRDTKFTFKTLSKTHVKGYLLWAEPTVKHMQKYPRYRKIWKHIAQHRANDIAWRLNEGKFDLLGRIYAGIGEPVCWALGNFVSDKQISKYNLTHWRRV